MLIHSFTVDLQFEWVQAHRNWTVGNKKTNLWIIEAMNSDLTFGRELHLDWAIQYTENIMSQSKIYIRSSAN